MELSEFHRQELNTGNSRYRLKARTYKSMPKETVKNESGLYSITIGYGTNTAPFASSR